MENSNGCTKYNDKSFTPKFHQSYSSYGGIGRKNNEEEYQISPRTRSNRFPHKEGILIGRIVDLDLLYLLLKWEQELWRKYKDKSSRNVNNGGKNSCVKLGAFGEEDPGRSLGGTSGGRNFRPTSGLISGNT
jgi:hypothetical protein